MTTGPATDADLVAAVLKGDQPAFTELMGRHKGWLYGFIRRHVPSSDDAYDILQETFTSAWQALKRYDPTRPLDAWLRRIALNKCRDRARREAVRRRVFGFAGLSADTADAVADTAAQADDVQIAGETLRRLNEGIARLPGQLREALVLTALQGLSQREAAETLGASVKVVEMRVYRARKQLAAFLERTDATDLGRLG